MEKVARMNLQRVREWCESNIEIFVKRASEVARGNIVF